jgi:iron complex outermembrane receptor protein
MSSSTSYRSKTLAESSFQCGLAINIKIFPVEVHMRLITPYVAALSLISFPLSPVVLAQAGAVLEEVIVSARKRDENVQSTPIAITAITGASIDESKLFTVSDIEQKAPNLSFSAANNGSSGSLQAFQRGIGQFDSSLTTDPGVGLYLDGIYLARTVGSNFELSDIASIDVLRGPQGTLYGKNTIGGAIAVTTKVPTGETSYMGQVTGGEDEYVSFAGYAEAPVTDDLAASVAVLTKNSAGWQQRNQNADAGNNNMWAMRTHLNANFTDNWSSHLAVDYTHIDQNVYPQVLTDFNPNAAIPSLYNQFVGPIDGICCTPNVDDIDRSDVLNELDIEKNNMWGASWINTIDINELMLKSITGYRDMDSDNYRDADNAPNVYFEVGNKLDTTQFSQEFILSNASGSRFDWLVGVYYLEEDGKTTADVTVAEGLFEAIGAAALDFTLDYDTTQDTTSYATFVYTTWHWTDAARINLAARYTYDEKKLEMYTIKRASQTPIVLPGPTGPSSCSDVTPDGNGSRFSCEDDWSEVSPKIGFDYDFSDDIMGYSSISQGFRSGIYNGRPTSTAQISVADPETLTSYEIGLKTQLWDRRLQLNGAVFYDDYKDQQFLVNRPSTTSASDALALVVANAADSTISGVEVEFTALPMENLTLTGGASWLDAKYNSFDSFNPSTGQLEDLSDRQFQNVPDWTASLAAIYNWQLNDGSTIRLRGDAYYKGEIFYANDYACSCFDRLNVDGFTTYNAGITFVTADAKWEVSVFGRNLGDERQINGGFGVDAFGTTTAAYTAPRTYYASIKYSN